MVTLTSKLRTLAAQKTSVSVKIKAVSIALNSALNSEQVPLEFRAHYVNVTENVMGIEQLIAQILKTNGATNVAGAMFFSEIEASVRKSFGANRYPKASLYTYLIQRMPYVSSVQLSGVEDKGRTSPRPRKKFYLAEQVLAEQI